MQKRWLDLLGKLETWTNLVGALLVLVILLFVWYELSRPKSPTPSLAFLNQPFPQFKAVTLDLGELQMPVANQDLLGHITLLHAWASSCIPCQAEHAFWMGMAQVQDSQVLIYGLNYQDDQTAALHWLKQKGNPYTLDIYDPKGNLAEEIGIFSVPQTFLIDQNGIIRYKYKGAINSEVWQQELLPRIRQLQKQ